MSRIVVIAALGAALSGCGNTATDEPSRHGDPSPARSLAGAAPTLELSADIDPSGCDTVKFHEVWDVTRADGTPLPVGSYECRWAFDDGATSDACSGDHAFSSPGLHGAVVRVTELATGATGTAKVAPRPVWDELAIDVVAQAPSCGLAFDYAITKSGGKPSGGFNFVSVTRDANVVAELSPDGASDGTIQVSEPGSYVISVYREEETTFTYCTASDSAEVSVSACP